MKFLERPAIRLLIRIAAVACVVAIAILSLTPKEHMVRTSLGGHFEHFSAYAGCAFFCALTVARQRNQIAVFLLLAAYAGLMEFLQQWVPGRHPAFEDFLFSSAGAALGMFLSLVAVRLKL